MRKLFQSKADANGRYHGENGSYNATTNTIRLDVNAGANSASELSRVTLLRTMSHELTHALQQNSPAQYDALKRAVLDVLTSKSGASIEEMAARMRERDSSLKDNGAALDEVVAEACENMLRDSDAMEQLIAQHPAEAKTFLEKVKQFFTDIVNAIRAAFGGSDTSRSREATALMQQAEEYLDICEKWSKALQDTAEISGRMDRQTGDGDVSERFDKGNEDIRYSLRETDDGRKVAVVDNDILQDIYDGRWTREKEKQAKAAARNALKKFNRVYVNNVETAVNSDTRTEYTGSDYTEALWKRSKNKFADKMRFADVMDDVVTATVGWKNDGILTHDRTDKFVDFVKGDVLLASGDTKYSARVVVGITRGGNYVLYDITSLKPAEFEYKKADSPLDYIRDNPRQSISGASTNVSIAPSDGSVKFSLRENVEQTKDLVAVHNWDDTSLDEMYEDAVLLGDTKKALSMLEEKARRVQADIITHPDVTTYKVHRGAPPKKTIKVYKTFTVDSSGRPTALFVSSNHPIPVGVWLDAQDTFHFTDTKNGHMYVPSTKNPNTKGGATGRPTLLSNISDSDLQKLEEQGYIKRKPNGEYSAKSITSLAYRPGWHAGDLPFFPQGGMKIAGSNYENVHRYNQVVYECEMSADVDYTAYDDVDGKVVYHDMQKMPTDGSYKFATNPMANSQDIGAWYISGSLKLVRPLTEQECNKILTANNRKAQEWQSWSSDGNSKDIGPLDLARLNVDPNRTDAYSKILEVTYDDNGNVIPLSERFNSENDDIRYQMRDDDDGDQGLVGIFDEAPRLEEAHIDQRTWDNMSDRRVHSFMNDYPASRIWLARMASVLQSDVAATTAGQRFMNEEETFTGQKRDTTPLLAEMKDSGYTWQQMSDVFGKMAEVFENGDLEVNVPETAIWKRAELILDRAVTEGYTDMNGIEYRPDAGYMRYKDALPGAKAREIPANAVEDTFEDVDNRLAGGGNAAAQTGGDGERVQLQGDTSYQEKQQSAKSGIALMDGGPSNRELLSSALESAAQTPEELRYVQSYKKQSQKIAEMEGLLAERRAEVQRLQVMKKRTADQEIRMKNLQQSIAETESMIDKRDKGLLKMEAMEPLRNVLDRERANYRETLKQAKKDAAARQREKDAAKLDNTLLATQMHEGREWAAKLHDAENRVAEANQKVEDLKAQSLADRMHESSEWAAKLRKAENQLATAKRQLETAQMQRIAERMAEGRKWANEKLLKTITISRSFGTPSGARTLDTLIKSQVLYQLS